MHLSLISSSYFPTNDHISEKPYTLEREVMDLKEST